MGTSVHLLSILLRATQLDSWSNMSMCLAVLVAACACQELPCMLVGGQVYHQGMPH